MRSGLSGLADAAADQQAINDAQAAVTQYQTQVNSIANQINYAQNQYSINHFGGQTPGQFASYISGLQSRLNQAQANLDKANAALQTAIAVQTENQSKQTVAQQAASTAAANPTAAQIAQSNQSTVQALRQLSAVASQPGYDYGVNSNARNKFYGVAGLDMKFQAWGLHGLAADSEYESRWGNIDRWVPPPDGGILYAGPGLAAINIGQDILKGITNALPQAAKETGITAASLGLPSIPLPAWLQTIGAGVQKQVTTDRQAQALVASQQAASARKAIVRPASSTGINWTWVAIGVGGAIILYRVVRR